MTSPPGFAPASREFFQRDALELAPDLLGCYLAHTTDDGTVGLIITEMEAYTGERDPGSHAFRGKTARNSTMFGEAGHLYAYFTYGMHYAINVVAGEVGHPYGCLVRAGHVIEGADLARRRRTKPARVSALPDRDLARGPGNLAQALGAEGHVSYLRRTRVGPFSEENAITLEKLEELVHRGAHQEALLPVATALDDIPVLAVTDEEAFRLSQGRGVVLLPRQVVGMGPEGSMITAMHGQKVAAICERRGGEIRPVRVFNL